MNIPRAEGDPYYPIPRQENAELYQQYQALADARRRAFRGPAGHLQVLQHGPGGGAGADVFCRRSSAVGPTLTRWPCITEPRLTAMTIPHEYVREWPWTPQRHGAPHWAGRRIAGSLLTNIHVFRMMPRTLDSSTGRDSGPAHVQQFFRWPVSNAPPIGFVPDGGWTWSPRRTTTNSPCWTTRASRPAALRVAREGVRWHLVEQTAGHYDFSSVRPILQAAQATGTQVIWDLCHFGWPDHLDVFKPEFVSRLAQFGGAFARLLAEETDLAPFFVPDKRDLLFFLGRRR